MTSRGKWLDSRLHKNRTQSKLNPDEVDDMPRCFQVSVNILEGKRLAWANPCVATSYIVVALDKVQYRTSVRQNMKVPFYRENFLFELLASVREVQRGCLRLSVMESCCGVPRLLGEANVDLAYIWRQPHHTIAHKWVQLTLPDDMESKAVGYLKVDISIAFRGQVPAATVGYQERIEDNVLLPCGLEQQPASYQLTVYGAFNVPCSPNSRPDMLGNPPNTCLRVTFCGLVGKTSTQSRSSDPLYVERVSFVEMFPNVCDLMELEVCSVNGGAKVLASTRLRLSQISHSGENGFLPTFGPSLLHMYGRWCSESEDDGPFYRGTLLLAMKTIVPYYKQSIRTINVEPVTVAVPTTEWILEDFFLVCPIFEVSMLNKTTSGGTACGVAITVGEIPCTSSVDQGMFKFMRQMSVIKQKKLHYTGNLGVKWDNPIFGALKFDTCPLLQLAARLPDFRFRMYRNNVLYGIVTDLEKDLSTISTRLRNDYGLARDLIESLRGSIDNVATKVLKFLNIVQSSSNENERNYTTELDQKIVQLQKERMRKIYRRIESRKNKCTEYLQKNRLCDNCPCKKILKVMLAEGKTIVEDLKKLIFKTPDGWPEISVWLLSNGSRVAYSKMAPADVIYSVTAEQSGRSCGKIQTLYLKPVKCTIHASSLDCCCIAGKVELLAWLGAYRQLSSFQYCLPVGYQLSADFLGVECEPLSIECCVNIYRANLDSGDVTHWSPFLRISFMNDVKDTQVQKNTVNPVWSEVLRFWCNARVSPERLEISPPEILVEVYHFAQTDKIDLLGRSIVTPVFLKNFNVPSPLEWYEVHMGTELIGKIQMSAQLILVPESKLKKTWTKEKESHNNSSQHITQVQFLVNQEGREPLPLNLIPENNTYKIDVYWWGLRDVSFIHKPCVSIELEAITIESGVITECKNNRNFPNDRISRIFQGNLTNDCPSLTIKLYDSTTFGRTTLAGLNVIKKPQKYLVDWMPKEEREEMMFSRSIASNTFIQVNRNTLVKKHSLYSINENSEKSFNHEEEEKPKLKHPWRRIFSKKAEEEELTLLPVFSKAKHNAKKTADDWWTRYYASLNDKASDDKEWTRNRLTIYESELEGQPGFSRFKDWCSTIKMYSRNKTGIPEQDAQLQCGFLKAGIAIYEWPPPEGTVAVSCSGVDLDRGYFDSAPENDPALYLVRVYVVKCSGLATKGYTASKCHVAVQCGAQQLDDCSSGVLRSADPTFGRMYELRCTLPEDYLLKVSVMDSGQTSLGDLIGCTCIDLEDRAYTKHRATVGLASVYNITGPNKWRDSQRPTAILEQLCVKNHLPTPVHSDPSTVVLNGVEYKDLQSGTKYTSPLIRKENICLSILHEWHSLPVCGHRLVPEHVETRPLVDPEQPGVEQGKIHLWVDMFPLDSGQPVPAPVDITPRPTENYELRVIVWGVQDVKLASRGTNIYVKAWLGLSDEAQDTDVYYSTKGEGTFNWRMIFQFQYRHTEKKLVIHDKCPYAEAIKLLPPILVVQVLDVEAPSPHDVLGTLLLDLSSLRGGRSTRHWTAQESKRPRADLFTAPAREWWPLRVHGTGSHCVAGMIDLEIAVLPIEKALLMPVGLGRRSPAPLPDPIRHITGTAMDMMDTLWSLGRWQGTPALVLGLVCVGACFYWGLPLMLLDFLGVLEPSRSDFL